MKLPISKLSRCWDELQKMSREDDLVLDLGSLRWCDFYYAVGSEFEIEEDTYVNCADDCDGWENEDCFMS